MFVVLELFFFQCPATSIRVGMERVLTMGVCGRRVQGYWSKGQGIGGDDICYSTRINEELSSSTWIGCCQ